MNRFERDIRAIEEKMAEHAQAFQAIYKKADDEDRRPTDDENEKVREHHKAIEVLKVEKKEAQAGLKTLQEVDEIGRKLGPAVSTMDMRVISEPQDRAFERIKSLGELFTDSQGYKNAINEYRNGGGRFREGFSTGAVSLEMKGTLLEGAGGGGGAIAATVPQVIPGVVDKLFQQLTVADLIMRFAKNAPAKFIPTVLYRYTDHPGTDSHVRAGNQMMQTSKIKAAA